MIFLKHFQISQENTWVDKVTAVSKFLRTPILEKIYKRLLLPVKVRKAIMFPYETLAVKPLFISFICCLANPSQPCNNVVQPDVSHCIV